MTDQNVERKRSRNAERPGSNAGPFHAPYHPMMGVKIQRGLDAPLPEPELTLGNIVRLKEPDDDEAGRVYRWGIIVEHLGHNAWGVPMVSLHIYDDDGRLMTGPNHIPDYNDYAASEFVLWKIATATGSGPIGENGFDLYPPCPVCRDKDQHPFADEKCKECGGWGHVRQMRRLPTE